MFRKLLLERWKTMRRVSRKRNFMFIQNGLKRWHLRIDIISETPWLLPWVIVEPASLQDS